MERNRLFWASRRGMLELDLILIPFLDNHYDSLAPEDKDRYHLLLDCEDQDLFGWFLNRIVPEDVELKKIVTIVREKNGVL